MYQILQNKKSNRTLILDAKTITILKMEIRAKKYLLKLGYTQPSRIFTNEENEFTINQAITDRYNIYRKRLTYQTLGFTDLDTRMHLYYTMLVQIIKKFRND